MTIDADGTMTVTTSTASVSNYIQTLVYLEPGRTYHLGLFVETVAYTSGTGVSAALLPFAGGYEYLDLSQSTSSAAGFGDGINWIEYAGSAAGVHKYINAELTIPIPQRKRAYIRSRAWAGNTVDLSVNKFFIRFNIDGAGNPSILIALRGRSAHRRSMPGRSPTRSTAPSRPMRPTSCCPSSTGSPGATPTSG